MFLYPHSYKNIDYYNTAFSIFQYFYLYTKTVYLCKENDTSNMKTHSFYYNLNINTSQKIYIIVYLYQFGKKYYK